MHIVDARSCEKKWRANIRESTRCAIACGSLKRGQCFHTHQADFGAGLGAEFFPRDVEIKLTTVVQLLPVVHSNAVAAQKEYGLDEIATPRIYLREKGSWRGPPSYGTVCVFVIFHRVLLPIETNKTFQVLFCCDHLIRKGAERRFDDVEISNKVPFSPWASSCLRVQLSAFRLLRCLTFSRAPVDLSGNMHAARFASFPRLRSDALRCAHDQQYSHPPTTRLLHLPCLARACLRRTIIVYEPRGYKS